MYFHYTSIEALVGIVTGRSVWLSSLAFMNDEMEGFDLYEVLTEYVGSDVPSQKTQLDLLRTTVETFLRWQLCFSASTLRDDISQWRAYTTIGAGACLEFEDGFLPEHDLKRLECIYRIEEKQERLGRSMALRKSGETLNQLLAEQEGVQTFVDEVVDALAQFKHRSFEPEKEVRWILSLTGLSDPRANLSYRPHRLGLVSYQPVPVDLTKVVSVTLGPQVPEQNLKTVEDFLIQYECTGFVKKSQVSLR